jgi:hypothetical protein
VEATLKTGIPVALSQADRTAHPSETFRKETAAISS